MERTIEERAEATLESYDWDIYYHHSELTEDSFKDGYIQGATEQQAIDDKVAFEERDKAFKAGHDTAIEEALKAFCKTHGCCILHSTCTLLGTCDEYDAFNRELTKAMEG